MEANASALGYSTLDLERLRALAPGGIETPSDIGRVIDSFGYLAEWKEDYKIRSVRSSLHSDKITCIDSAVLSYGLLELLFPKVKRRLLAIHRKDMHGEECGHCITLYWNPDGRVGAFSKSSFVGFNHREPIYRDELAIAKSFAEAYLKMDFVPLYYGVMTLEEAGEGLDWRFAEKDINTLSERLIARYEYAFDL
ncbi:MAG: hypothetical protein ACXWP5_07260 [Bdellovibrionota bacterium]